MSATGIFLVLYLMMWSPVGIYMFLVAGVLNFLYLLIRGQIALAANPQLRRTYRRVYVCAFAAQILPWLVLYLAAINGRISGVNQLFLLREGNPWAIGFSLWAFVVAILLVVWTNLLGGDKVMATLPGLGMGHPRVKAPWAYRLISIAMLAAVTGWIYTLLFGPPLPVLIRMPL